MGSSVEVYGGKTLDIGKLYLYIYIYFYIYIYVYVYIYIFRLDSLVY